MAIIKRSNRRGRRIPIGKYSGELVERVMVTDPDYIQWFRESNAGKTHWIVTQHIDLVVELIDAMPFHAVRCEGGKPGERCELPVVRFSLTEGSREPHFWCAECDPLKVSPGAIIRTKYAAAVNHGASFGSHSKLARLLTLTRLLQAKGATFPMTDDELIEFLHGPGHTAILKYEDYG